MQARVQYSPQAAHRVEGTEKKGSENYMIYRIEYTEGKCCTFADSHKDLIEQLKQLKNETITDIRKLYKNGVSDSVMEQYAVYLHKSK